MSEATMRDPLKCGECGGDTFALANVRPMDGCRFGGGGSVAPVDGSKVASEVSGYIEVKCRKCGQESILSVAAPRLTTDGPLCGGW